MLWCVQAPSKASARITFQPVTFANPFLTRLKDRDQSAATIVKLSQTPLSFFFEKLRDALGCSTPFLLNDDILAYPFRQFITYPRCAVPSINEEDRRIVVGVPDSSTDGLVDRSHAEILCVSLELDTTTSSRWQLRLINGIWECPPRIAL